MNERGARSTPHADSSAESSSRGRRITRRPLTLPLYIQVAWERAPPPAERGVDLVRAMRPRPSVARDRCPTAPDVSAAPISNRATLAS
jgi:hypothetical protein